MFGKKLKGELSPPPNAKNAGAVEILRVWAEPKTVQQVVLQTAWKDPGVWGLMLADVARHAAKAYAAEGMSEPEVLDRILQFLRAELASPTDVPIQLA